MRRFAVYLTLLLLHWQSVVSSLILSSNQLVLSLVSATWELCVFLFLFFEILAEFVVTASRGVACVFAARKRALVYILEEDEDEVSDAE